MFDLLLLCVNRRCIVVAAPLLLHFAVLSVARPLGVLHCSASGPSGCLSLSLSLSLSLLLPLVGYASQGGTLSLSFSLFLPPGAKRRVESVVPRFCFIFAPNISLFPNVLSVLLSSKYLKVQV